MLEDFSWILSDSKSPQISSIFLDILEKFPLLPLVFVIL